MALTFWYDFSSTYSCLSARRLTVLASAAGVSVRWQPFLLGPLFAAAGYAGSPNLANEAKARHMWRDLERRAAKQGDVFVKPSVFPQRSVAAARAVIALPDAERPALTVATFEEVFARGRDVADLDVLADAARAAGLPVDRVLAGAVDPAAKAALFAASDQAQSLGLFGAPSFVAGDGELFWGDDRLEDALAWERGAASAAA